MQESALPLPFPNTTLKSRTVLTLNPIRLKKNTTIWHFIALQHEHYIGRKKLSKINLSQKKFLLEKYKTWLKCVLTWWLGWCTTAQHRNSWENTRCTGIFLSSFCYFIWKFVSFLIEIKEHNHWEQRSEEHNRGGLCFCSYDME